MTDASIRFFFWRLLGDRPTINRSNLIVPRAARRARMLTPRRSLVSLPQPQGTGRTPQSASRSPACQSASLPLWVSAPQRLIAHQEELCNDPQSWSVVLLLGQRTRKIGGGGTSPVVTECLQRPPNHRRRPARQKRKAIRMQGLRSAGPSASPTRFNHTPTPTASD